MAEVAQLIKELVAMDVSIYEIMLLGVVLITAWRVPDIIRAVKEQ